MEISPVGRRRSRPARTAIWVSVVILTPVTLLALLPTAFGLQRFVMSDHAMTGSVGRGSVMFDRTVPASDIEVGDVVTFTPPSATRIDRLVTRRVVEVSPGFLRTRADNQGDRDPWTLSQADYPALSRNVVSVPWIGEPFLLAGGGAVWKLIWMGAAGLLLISLWGDTGRPRYLRARGRPVRV